MIKKTFYFLICLYPLTLGHTFPYQNLSSNEMICCRRPCPQRPIDLIQERQNLYSLVPLKMISSLQTKSLKEEIARNLATRQDEDMSLFEFEEENKELSCNLQGFCR